MKKRFWIAPVMALAVVCTLLLSACGGPSVEELIREDITKAMGEITPDDEELLDAMEASSDGGFDQLGIDTKDFATAYLGGFDHEIKSVTVDEEAGTAEAVVTVKMKSLSAIMSNFMTEFQAYVDGIDPTTVGSEEELYMKAGEILMESVRSAEPSETDCTFEYEKDDEGGWSATEGTENAILEAMA